MHKFIVICLLTISSSASAQSLSVFNLDATNFPTMEASFYAFDSNGQQVSPSPSDITVTEDGIVRTITGITCPPKTTPPPITLGIMVDTYSGIDLAKYGAQKLIDLVSIPPSEAGITMLDHGAFIVQDLTQQRRKLTTAIPKLSSAAGVDLQTMFYAPNAGGVPFVSGRPNKKVLVLITDLHCPLFNLDKKQLYQDAASQSISVYIILLGTSDEFGYAKEITDSTGGKLFEMVRDSSELGQAMSIISSIATDKLPCEFTWKTNGGCTVDPRNAQFLWNGDSSRLSYTLPANDIAQMQFSLHSLYIQSKPVGVKFDTIVTVTAINTGFTITNISSTNPSYDINPKSFSIAFGQSQTLTISYTPLDSNYSWTRFDIATDHCALTYFASASYPGKKPTLPTLKLTSPNGGEVFLVGIDTMISWTGIPLTDTVRLEYSLDSGSSWNLITDKASGGKYSWNVPIIPSKLCLVKITQLNLDTIANWVKQYHNYSRGIATDALGDVYITGQISGAMYVAKYDPSGTREWTETGIGGDAAAGYDLAVDNFGNIYVIGIFNKTCDFSNIKLTSKGLVYNIFIAKYHSDGTIEWAKRAGCGPEGLVGDFGNGIAIDPKGNLYITGGFEGGADFDTILLKTNSIYGGHSQIFIAKYLPDGNVVWAKRAGGMNDNISNSVAIDSLGNAYITGYFEGKADFSSDTLVSTGAASGFIAKYLSDGSKGWVKPIGATGNSIAADKIGNLYVTGRFAGVTDFGGSILTSSGSGDVFLAKYHTDSTLDWVTSAGDINSDASGKAIAMDNSGNIYVAGSFLGKANFKGIILNSAGGNNIFVAKYHPIGSIEWAKQAGSPGDSYGNGICLDDGTNIYITGTFSGSVSIGGTSLFQSNTGSSDVFIWKIGDNILQSDTSDMVFSIIAPTFSFASNSIDMGQVEQGREKDSVVKATICNSGSVPLHVLGMDVTSGDKAEFMIMSGAGDFTLQPGQCRDVMFTYMPMMMGKMSATVTLRTSTGDYPDTIKILGEGIAPLLSVMGNVIDFGQVKIGNFKDTIISVAIQNIGNLPVNFSPATQLGPDVIQFSLLSSAAGFSLSPGASQSVTLRFSPHYVGRTSGRIAFDYNAPSSPAILSVFGQGLGGLVTIPEDSGYAGDHKNIPMILEKVPVTSIQSLATNYSARIAYDNSVLEPIGGVIQKGNRFDTINVSGLLGTSDTLDFLPFTALLGERTISPLNIVDFSWLDGAGNPADYDADTKSGTFTVLYGCGDSLLWNFMSTGRIASITSVNPNPSNGIIHIDIQTTESGRTQLQLFNLLGQKVGTISDGELKPGLHTFDFDSHNLNSGSYFLTLTTPTVRRMERVDIAK